MKLLKNDSTIFVEQIMKKINSCYTGSNPSNSQLTELYSLIGKNICGQGEKAFVAHLAEILSEQFAHLKGFSPRNLRRMRDFYVTYQSDPKLMKKAQTLSWTQNTVILECCESNEQRSFYLTLAEKNNLSKLALVKAIKEETCEQALAEEYNLETETHCCPFVSDLCDTEDSNTTLPIKNDCRAFVPKCKPFRQRIGIGKIKHRAFRYIYLRKVDVHYLKMIHSVTAKKSIESATKRFRYFIRCVPPLASIAQRMKIPIFLMT